MCRWKLIAFTFCILFTVIFSALSYELITTTTDASSSKGLCADIGMQQVIIRDTQTHEEVKNFLRNVSTEFLSALDGGDLEIWVGMYWDSHNETFRWFDNDTKADNINWDESSHEPNCMTPSLSWSLCKNECQNCVRMVKDVFKTTSCLKQHYTLCQRRTYFGPKSVDDVTTINNVTREQRPINDVTTNQMQQVTCEPCPTSDITTNKNVHPTSYEITANAIPNQSNAPSQSFNESSFQDSLFKVKKRETGSYRRRHTSAYDGRFSSKVIGLTGVTILVIVCCIFPAVDMMNLFTKTYKKQRK